MNNETNQAADAFSAEDYSKAMNIIAENLLSTLVQSVQKLPPEFSNRKVIVQALSAFLANVIYKQFPEDEGSSQKMLNDFTNIIQIQLDNMYRPVNATQD
ncbi:MAG: hypothetical protein H0U57_03205 [Tatlockia sp.]|nr:hypothetical protein [Tatlockia sp.]